MSKLKVLSFVLAVTSIPLAVDATLLALPGIPPKVAMYWPLVLAVSSALHKWASTYGEEK
jgi:hypothetical protein